MRLNTLSPAAGSKLCEACRSWYRFRLGKTGGRGHKGQKSRSRWFCTSRFRRRSNAFETASTKIRFYFS